MASADLSKASVLICDDVRQELGGKVSLMGLFREVGVAEVPALLPRFFAVLFLRGGKGLCPLSVEWVAPSGSRKSLWSKQVELRGEDAELIEVIGLWNLQLAELGSHKIVLSTSKGPFEEAALEVGKAPR